MKGNFYENGHESGYDKCFILEQSVQCPTLDVLNILSFFYVLDLWPVFIYVPTLYTVTDYVKLISLEGLAK